MALNGLKEYAESFDPAKNTVTLKNGDVVEYDYMVVCPGLQLDWNKVKGLEETDRQKWCLQ